MDESTQKVAETAFDKLKSGISFTSIKGDVRQPHNYAMGRIPARYSRWTTASIYATDVERIVRELKTALSFVVTLPDSDFLVKHSTNTEDYIMYHQGYFLDLVHQLKDKLCQLTKAIVTYEGDYPKDAAVLSKLLKNKIVERIPRLQDHLKEWDAYDPLQKGVISVALKKRTFYHHYKNPLPNTDSYFKAKTHRFLLSPTFQANLSELGKKMVTERSQQNQQSWQTDTVAKMTATLKAIEGNVEGIAQSFVSYYRLSHTAEAIKRDVQRYTTLDELLGVPDSNYQLKSIRQPIRGILEILAGVLPFALEQEFVALYVTGSIPRGDFIMGLSNINFVVVLKNDTAELKAMVQQFIDSPALELRIPIETKIFSEADFSSPERTKERFICRTDGLLLAGNYSFIKESDQRVSFKLAWLLNKDFKEYLASTKALLADTSRPLGQRDITLIARELGKQTYRLGFSQVMGNNIRYSNDFKEMRRLNNFYYPSNQRFNDHLFEYISKHPLAERNALLSIVESVEEKMLPLYDAVDKVVNGTPK